MKNHLLAVTLSALALAFTRPGGAQTPANATDKADSAAYWAFAQHDAAALAAARAKGGDAARFAKSNPSAIVDAVEPERDLETLAFVLKSGANPGKQKFLSGTVQPILRAGLDIAKIGLLIKAGADINARELTGQTPLGSALSAPTREFKYPPMPKPGATQRVYSKLDVVRFLLDAGATIHDGSAGPASGGSALARTRREDKDVIALLLARGATFKGVKFDEDDFAKKPINRGPLHTALMMERDDLAMALLARDQRIAANDELALLHAVRRGFSDVALALLQAGANARVADSEGNTPLMFARKGRDAKMIAALLKAGATDRPDLPKASFEYESLSKFTKQVATIIDDAAAMDTPRFGLEPRQTKPLQELVLYSDGKSRADPIVCERVSTYAIISSMNVADGIGVGSCTAATKRIVADVEKSFLNRTTQPGLDADSMAKMGWVWKQEKLPSGARGFEFPLLATYGVTSVAARNYVLIDKSGTRAVVVQASIGNICANGGVRTPLCTDTSRVFAEIAERVSRLRQN